MVRSSIARPAEASLKKFTAEEVVEKIVAQLKFFNDAAPEYKERVSKMMLLDKDDAGFLDMLIAQHTAGTTVKRPCGARPQV